MFSDRRNLDCLVQERTSTTPVKTEHLLYYGTRLERLRSQVEQRYSNDVNMFQPEIEYEIIEKLYGNFSDRATIIHTNSYNNNYQQPNTSRNPNQNLIFIIKVKNILKEFTDLTQTITAKTASPLPTNTVFGPPQNVFEPKNTPRHLLPIPAPMSETSRYIRASKGSNRNPNSQRNKQYYPRNTYNLHHPIKEELLHKEY